MKRTVLQLASFEIFHMYIFTRKYPAQLPEKEMEVMWKSRGYALSNPQWKPLRVSITLNFKKDVGGIKIFVVSKILGKLPFLPLPTLFVWMKV